MKVLLIDDDQRMSAFIRLGLEDHDYSVIAAFDGQLGERLATTKKFDVIILDVMLPGISGFELCKRIREKQVQTPILMLTSLDSTEDKVTGLEIGADDYLGKPFQFSELLARIKALVRRSTEHIVEPVIRVSDLEIDTLGKKVKRAGKEIRLTAREYKILEMMASSPGKVFERIEIAQKIWGFSFDTGTNVIDVHINALRKKIDRDFSPKLIQTVVGLGYVMTDRAS